MPRSQPKRSVMAPPTAAPTAMNATWPRLTCPAQPVSTTSEMPTMPNSTITVARFFWPSSSHIGSVTRKAATASSRP